MIQEAFLASYFYITQYYSGKIMDNQIIVKICQPSIRLGDPHVNSDDRNKLSPTFNIFNSLVKIDKGMSYKPSLAEKWTLSDDAYKWNFYIRNDVCFHDGKILTADDIVESLNRAISPNIKGELGTTGIYASYLADAEIKALDSYLLTIITPTPNADLLDILSQIPILSKENCSSTNIDLIGTGPYKLDHYDDINIKMSRFPKYWGKEPFYDQIIWNSIPDPIERINSLLAGNIDIITDLPAQYWPYIQTNGDYDIRFHESSVSSVFMCNLSSGPCCEKKIRQALNYALDRDEIISKIMYGAANKLTGPFSANHFGFNPSTIGYEYDPEKAKSLLKQTGYERGLEITLDIPQILPDEAVELASLMRDQYKRIGIKTNIVIHENRSDYAKMVRNKKLHDAACFDSSPISTGKVLQEKFRRDGPWCMGYDNPIVERLISQGKKEPDAVKRKILYQKAYQIISDDAVWIFLYNPILAWAYRKEVTDWNITVDNLISFENL